MNRLAFNKPLAIAIVKGAWCTVCIEELQRLSAHIEAGRTSQFRFVALVGESSADDLDELNAMGLAMRIYSASAEVFEALDMWLGDEGYPLPGMLFIDRCGVIRVIHRGRAPNLPQDGMSFRILHGLAQEEPSCGLLTQLQPPTNHPIPN